MKFLATLAVAAAAVNAVAIPDGDNVVKRAAEAVADALNEPRSCPFGQQPPKGKPCTKVKREAIAEALPACYMEGEACEVAKRNAEALAEALADSAPEGDFLNAVIRSFPEPMEKREPSCPFGQQPPKGKPCTKVKREAIAAVCSEAGQPCDLVQRAAEAVLDVYARSEEEHLVDARSCAWGQKPPKGKPCSKVRRELDARNCAWGKRPQKGKPCSRVRRELDEHTALLNAVNVARDILANTIQE